MRLITILIIGLLALFFSVTIGHAQNLHLYNDVNRNVYLGCLTCKKYSTNSIWNAYGQHGSEYSVLSIWNKYGTYGSEYSVSSPWNMYSSTPPVLIDDYGNFSGYFTRNRYLYGRTQNKFALWVLDNYDFIIENFDRVVDNLE